MRVGQSTQGEIEINKKDIYDAVVAQYYAFRLCM